MNGLVDLSFNHLVVHNVKLKINRKEKGKRKEKEKQNSAQLPPWPSSAAQLLAFSPPRQLLPPRACARLGSPASAVPPSPAAAQRAWWPAGPARPRSSARGAPSAQPPCAHARCAHATTLAWSACCRRRPVGPARQDAGNTVFLPQTDPANFQPPTTSPKPNRSCSRPDFSPTPPSLVATSLSDSPNRR
jgi:hypothetical protein